MRVEQLAIKRRAVSFAEITATYLELNAVVEDMLSNAGEFMPTPNWVTLDPDAALSGDARALTRDSYSPERFERQFATLDKVLFSWIGARGAGSVEDWLVRLYSIFHAQFDPCGLFDYNVLAPERRATLRNADLASVLELSLLGTFAPATDGPTVALEVGGGYGRLA